MKYLLDTHVFLWLMRGENLSEAARKTFLDRNNQIYLSAGSYWEICIKVGLSKLAVTPEWMDRFDQELIINDIHWLPIEKTHAQQVVYLPLLHRDPFDRILIAHSQFADLQSGKKDSKLRGC
jgi:PIN domain nuclease of toxin-antitoxin system